MQGSGIGYTGLAAVALCALALVAPAAAHASDPVSAECAVAKAKVESAKEAVQRARAKLRRAREDGDQEDVERARRKLRRKKAKLDAAKADRQSACSESQNPYVALGDSVTAGYASRLFPHYQSTLGANEFLNRARGGETSGSLRANGQLTTALADINGPTDTRVVTINIGGNDALAGPCAWSEPSCPFRANFSATLNDLVSALAADPGQEPLVTMAYYNPASGRGDSQEAQFDMTLLGSDGVRDCAGTGSQLGLNDVISQEAAANGALLADAYPAFRQGGQALMGDSIHPNAAGYDAIAEAFKNASAPCG
jgi:lysophospholipase L1-like esterase